MKNQETRKTHLQSSRLPPPTAFQTLALCALGLVLTPIFFLLACAKGVPGMSLRWKCFIFGLSLLFNRKGPLDFKTIWLICFFPLDSTRYFELDFAWRALAEQSPGKYLDVSSPRLLFTLLLRQHGNLTAELINPDKADLADTTTLVRASGVESRASLRDCVISDAPFSPASFDTITSISVVEHIPEDRKALERIWELLKPGGRFILTVPCSAESSEQYIDRDEYGIIGKGADGSTFWQRFYDEQLLKERVFSVTGPPQRMKIFCENTPGLFLKSANRKRSDRFYPFWREPWMVGREYRFFDSIHELPGEGVIAMEFVKS
jgi:SAM-dependent methyltransferase